MEIGGELACITTDVVSPNVTRDLIVPGLEVTLVFKLEAELGDWLAPNLGSETDVDPEACSGIGICSGLEKRLMFGFDSKMRAGFGFRRGIVSS